MDTLSIVKLLALYRRMLLIRRFEERVYYAFLLGEIPGTVHQYQGQEAVAVGGIPATRKVLASPAVRQLARAHGIELDELRGSGPGGRIEKEDVLRLLHDQDRET